MGEPSTTSNIVGSCQDVQRYEKVHRIGEGTYGFVYCALDKINRNFVALKRIILHNEASDGFPLTSIREIACLKRCSVHPNVVKLLDIAVGAKRDAVFLVFEYCEHDLATILRNIKNPFRESEIKSLMKQLLSAISFLHSQFIIHRDIKPSNLLYNNRGELKLADFGLARTLAKPSPGDLTSNVITLYYRPPELLLGSEVYDDTVDIWSSGCIMGELLLSQPLLPGRDNRDQTILIFQLLGGPNPRIWPEVLDLPLVANGNFDVVDLQKQFPYNKLAVSFPSLSSLGLELMNLMLTYDPSRRINAKKASKHDYFYSSPYPKECELMPTFPTFHVNVKEKMIEVNRTSSTSTRLTEKASTTSTTDRLSGHKRHLEGEHDKVSK